jgi:cold shock CspA family protein
MGFQKRKAISFGPVRFNLSRTGIGVSIGAMPGRFGTEPERTYVRIGRDGFSYRQCLDAAGSTTMSVDADLHGVDALPMNGPDASDLVVSSSREVLAHVNARASQAAHAPIIVALTVIVLLICTFFDALVAGWVMGVGAALALLFYNGDRHKRTSELLYQLADGSGEQFALMQAAFQTLARSQKIWLVQQEAAGKVQQESARGADRIVRLPVGVRNDNPPWINTNVSVWTIDLGRTKLFFFPDRLLVWDSRKYRAVSYESLGIAFAPTRFMEDGKPPGDSEVVDRAWRYADKEGEPDPRYASNTQLPVVLYGSIIFGAQNQLLAHLYVSSREVASRFAKEFRASLRSLGSGDDSNATSSASAEPGAKRSRTAKSPGTQSSRARLRGRVKWFNIEKGYGFITAQSGQEVMVILSQILADGLRSLPEGVAVEFEVVRGARGPMAVNVAVVGNDQPRRGWQGTGPQKQHEKAQASSPWEVLGVEVGASEDDVVAAYRRMAQMYHPDKVANLGPELKELADRKMREINAAYEALKRT